MHGSQVARQRPVKAKIAGSNPVRAAKKLLDKWKIMLILYISEGCKIKVRKVLYEFLPNGKATNKYCQ